MNYARGRQREEIYRFAVSCRLQWPRLEHALIHNCSLAIAAENGRFKVLNPCISHLKRITCMWFTPRKCPSLCIINDGGSFVLRLTCLSARDPAHITEREWHHKKWGFGSRIRTQITYGKHCQCEFCISWDLWRNNMQPPSTNAPPLQETHTDMNSIKNALQMNANIS